MNHDIAGIKDEHNAEDMITLRELITNKAVRRRRIRRLWFAVLLTHLRSKYEVRNRSVRVMTLVALYSILCHISWWRLAV